MSGWKNTLSFFALSTQTAHSTSISADVNTWFLLEVCNTVVYESVVKVFTSQVSISVCCFDLKNTIFNSQKWDIKSATTKIKDKNVAFTFTFLIETVSNSCGSWLIDNTLNIEARNSASILCSLSLRVIEVGWNSDDCVFDSLSKISFCNFFHFEENHGWDFFSLEFLSFSLELNNDHRFLAWTTFNFEWPELDVSLYCLVRELATNQTFSVEDSVGWVSSSLIFSSVTN